MTSIQSVPERLGAALLVASLSCVACLAVGAPPIDDAALRMRAPIASEASDWQRTSTHAEVDAFLRSLEALDYAHRVSVSTFGTTNEGRELARVVVADPMPADGSAESTGDRLRVLVNGNIHGGEVEGKEAVQMLLREFAAGHHAELLDDLVIQFVPIYNADGNDRIDVYNRASQNGPVQGVGERANAQELDLNRDFLKAESPESRALLGVFRDFDPHLFMDLHTTNGSFHGYHLTYSPSLSTNVDGAIDAFARGELIPEIRAAMLANHKLRVFDYGNFTRQGETRWVTYDHRPRFGTNYYGLRNRLSLLSEAYSYYDFRTRVIATRAFVLETLVASARNARAIRKLCAGADARAEAGDFVFGSSSELAPPVSGEVLVGGIDEIELPDDIGIRRVVRPEFHAEVMGIQSSFVARETTDPPIAWVIPFAPERADMVASIADLFDEHGVAFRRLSADAIVQAEHFVPTRIRVAERPFQGHEMVSIDGEWQGARTTALSAGSLVVPAHQALGRLAAQLLQPESEDSLLTWNFLDAGVRATEDGREGTYPVLRADAGVFSAP